MNWDIVRGNWNQWKGRAREAWGDLTDDDLDVIAGEKEQLVGRLQERYGWAREQAEDEIETWQEKYRDAA
ncbi:MAG: CsbD family protein [Fimbriimonadaceae bacterium]